MKNLLSFLLLVAAFSSCSWNSHETPAPLSNTASIEIDTPIVHRLPESTISLLNQQITATVDSIFKANSLNGSILVAKEGTIVYERYEGFQQYRSKQQPITPEASFHLASVSKTLTATAILQLHQNKLLNINDYASKYLNGFPLNDITIAMLLNHRSGLPNYVHYMERLGWDRKRPVTNKAILDFLNQRYRDIDIAKPDRSFNYSNTNYALLALIIEKVSGQTYAQYIKNQIFKPLGMLHSYVFSENDLQRAMPSFFRTGKQYAFDYLDLVYGDKNIYSTVRDMQKFEFALTEGKLINYNLLNLAYQGYSNEKPGIHNYGLGWRMLSFNNGKKIIYHNGWWHGNRTSFYRLLDEKVTIIALCNNDATSIYSVKKIANIFSAYFPASEFSQPSHTTVKSKKSVHTKQSKKTSAKKKTPPKKIKKTIKKAVKKKK